MTCPDWPRNDGASRRMATHAFQTSVLDAVAVNVLPRGGPSRTARSPASQPICACQASQSARDLGAA
jgi:hypothetical protein